MRKERTVKMTHYYISYAKEEKEKNIELWNEISNSGLFINNEWKGDYLVSSYKYNNKIYELWDNMELGIMSEIIERGE